MAAGMGLRARLLPALGALDASVLDPGAVFHVYHPVNDLVGAGAIADGLFRPLRTAFPDLERRDDLLMEGSFQGHDWIATMGHWCGTFAAPLFRIPPTQGLAFLRFGEVFRIVDGRIAEGYVHLDLLDLMRQAGCCPLPPSPGAALLVPGPATHDGILLAPRDAAEGAASLALVEAMLGGLGRFDRKGLSSMGQDAYWADGMLWHGPCGIGSTRGLAGFQRFHQRPFLTGFPDRKGGNHAARFGEGMYVVSTGWPSIHATWSGPYLGQSPSGQRITMRVMDVWRRAGDRLAENWVWIDLPHLFLQGGRDLFAHLPG